MKPNSRNGQNHKLEGSNEILFDISSQVMLREYPNVVSELLASAAEAALDTTTRIAEVAQKLLMQLEYWLNRTGLGRIMDGQKWIRIPLRQIRDWAFTHVSLSTLSRALNLLESLDLITVENLNPHRYDQTRSYTLNPEGLKKLHSFEVIVASTKPTVDDELVERDPALAAYVSETPKQPPTQRSQSSKPLGQVQAESLTWVFNRILADLCKQDYTVARSRQRVDEVAETLKLKGHTVESLKWFERWWYNHCWITRKKGKEREVPSLGNVLNMMDQAVEFALKQGWGAYDTR